MSGRGDPLPQGSIGGGEGGRRDAEAHVAGRPGRSRWPVGDGLESGVSVALRTKPKGVPEARGGDAPGVTLSPAVPSVKRLQKIQLRAEVPGARSLSL